MADNLNGAKDEALLSAGEQARYGLNIRERNGQVEAYFHAGGRDNVVASTKIGAHDGAVSAHLDSILREQMSDIEEKYKVKFAAPGEAVARQQTQGKNCVTSYGETILAKQPTFADVFGTRVALEHSQPSQLTTDGKTGVKIYFLEKPVDTQPTYGIKPTLALYTSDRNNDMAVYVTPFGEKLPATEADTVAPGRNLADVLEHELTHNSQNNNWYRHSGPLSFQPQQYGWAPLDTLDIDSSNASGSWGLRGKDGGNYVNMRFACGAPTAWHELKGSQWVGANGKLTQNPDQALSFTNEQVQQRAAVFPVTYYFPNPTEMFSEGLTSFRAGENTRRHLFIESPQLYRTVAKYDAAEIDHYYGVDSSGRSKFVRTPDGHVVARSQASLSQLHAFDRSVKFAP